MKNTILVLALLFIVSTTFGQDAQLNAVSNEHKTFKLSDDGMPQASKITRGGQGKYRNHARWYDIVDAVDKYFGTISAIYGNDNYNLMWTDSTILAPFSGQSGTVYDGVWIKSVMAVFDPVDPRFNDPAVYGGQTEIDRTKPYTIDSLFIPFVYTRNAAKPNVVDTLIISVIESDGNGTGNDLDIRYYGPTSQTAQNHGTDTLRFLHGFMDLNPASNKQYSFIPSTPTKEITIKVPLTVASENDTTSNGFNYTQVPINLNVPAGNVVAASIVFKSGDTWTPYQDTIYISGSFSTPYFNNLRFVAFEEFDNGFQEYTKGVWSQASLMRNDTSGWGNWHIPCYAFNNTSYEHQWFQWLVDCPTCGHVGVQDLFTSLNRFAIYPNPTDGSASVSFETNNPLHNASLNIVSITGNVISTQDLGLITKGEFVEAPLNTTELSSGFYFVQLQTDEGQYVEKFIVR